MAHAPSAIAGDLDQLARTPGRHAWIGDHAPYDFVGLPLRGATNLRAAAVHHGRYDVVWCYEDALAGFRPGQHELLVDELVRLIGERGRLVVRIDRNLADFTLVGLKHLLGRRHDTRVVVEHETADDAFTVVFGIERAGMDQRRSDAWTCAVQTRGNRAEQVVEFCRSVRDQDPDRRHEILVWGPAHPAYEPFDVTCHDPGYRDHLAEISRKKNDIASRARHPNLLIVHDRYRLDPGFFAGFARFGHDFDLVTVPQRYACGTHFPAYVAAEGTILGRGRSIDCRDYDTLRPGQYLNGGLLVAKTETLRAIRLNDLLFWNQWEDVELAWEFRNRGLPPRVNCFSSATTLGIGPEYTRHFIPERTALRQIGAGGTGVARTVIAGGRKLEQRLRPFFRRLAGRAR